jgi:hypothetical protein
LSACAFLRAAIFESLPVAVKNARFSVPFGKNGMKSVTSSIAAFTIFGFAKLFFCVVAETTWLSSMVSRI